MGVKLDEDPAKARAALETCVANPWLRRHPPTVTWPGGQFASGRLAPHSPLHDLVGDTHADAGVPTLHFGPGDVHRAQAA